MPKPKVRELSATIPSTTQLKLFIYPHKHGGNSYCVGFERKTQAGYVSQQFLTEWSENHTEQLKAFNTWKYRLGAE